MKEVQAMVYRNMDRISDVFEHFNVKPYFSVEEIKNPFGGNPEQVVTFTFVAPHYNGKTKTFKRNPASKTVEMLENEILAYMFQCVDTFVNI